MPMKSQSTFKLDPGYNSANEPIISAERGYKYIWIGNNAPNNKRCFFTLSGRKTLLKLAAAIVECAGGRTKRRTIAPPAL